MTTKIKAAQHLDEQELNKLLRYLSKNQLWTYYIMVRLGVSTALRFSDLSCLKWENVLHKRIITIKEKKTKFVFPYLKEEDFIGVDWVNKSYSPKHEAIIRRAIKKYNRSLGRMAEALDLRHFSSHTARHTWTAQLQALGYSIEEIKHSLNHASYKSTKEYMDIRFDNGIAKDVQKSSYQKRRRL